MTGCINRAIELLAEDQAIYYVGGHSGHVLTREEGRADALTWADYINVGMEHGAFDMTGLGEYMQGLAEAGPTRSGHRTPTVVVEAPAGGTDAANVRFNAWQFRQILGRGVHGVLLCQAESAEAVRAFVEACRDNRIPFLETCSPETITARLDEGVRVHRRTPGGNGQDRPRPPAACAACIAGAGTALHPAFFRAVTGQLASRPVFP
ncbi:MAG: hypothetical protein ACREE4_00085 [Stellaceae bacterium]